MQRDGFIRKVRFRDSVEIDEDAFPFTVPAVREIADIEFAPDVTFFVGENGSGKSTVLEAVAAVAGLNPEGGSKHLHFETRSTLSVLHEYLRIVRNPCREETSYPGDTTSAEDVASKLEELSGNAFGAYGGTSPHEQSHGESFISLVTERFGPEGLYLMDEPEAALSPTGQLALLARIDDLVADDSQFIIATHSPILMAYPEATIYEFSEDGVETVAYEETEHFELYREFINHRERFFQHLFD